MKGFISHIADTTLMESLELARKEQRVEASLYRQGSPDIDIDFFVPWCQYRLVEIDL